MNLTIGALGAERLIEIRNQMYDGNTFWTPSDFVVLEGDQVNLKLMNQLESDSASEHQFEIVGLVTPVKLAPGEIKDISFPAKQPGVYRIRNQNAFTEGRFIIIRK